MESEKKLQVRSEENQESVEHWNQMKTVFEEDRVIHHLSPTYDETWELTTGFSHKDVIAGFDKICLGRMVGVKLWLRE